MKLTIDTTIAVKGKHVHAMLRKELETKIIPVPGMTFEDSAWNKPMPIQHVTCNFEDNSYYFRVMEQFDTEEECKSRHEIMKLHGWKDL